MMQPSLLLRLIDILAMFVNEVKKRGHQGRSFPPPGDTGETEACALHLTFIWF